jgi:hypothetical protein
MRTSAGTNRTRWRAACALAAAGVVSGVAVTAGATPPGKDPAGQESVLHDVMAADREPLPAPHSQTPRQAVVPQQQTARAGQRTRVHGPRTQAPPNARGGGPRRTPDAMQCPGDPRCGAPDLSPNAPQRDWNRDPRVPPMQQQDDGGPAAGPQATRR